jgi:hypothetical protein
MKLLKENEVGGLEQKIKDLQRQLIINYSSSEKAADQLKVDKRVRDLEAQMAALVMKEIDSNLFKNQVLSHTPVSQLSHNSSHKNEPRQVSQLSRHIHNRSKSSNPTQRSNFIKIEDMNDDDDQE